MIIMMNIMLCSFRIENNETIGKLTRVGSWTSNPIKMLKIETGKLVLVFV